MSVVAFGVSFLIPPVFSFLTGVFLSRLTAGFLSSSSSDLTSDLKASYSSSSLVSKTVIALRFLAVLGLPPELGPALAASLFFFGVDGDGVAS